MPVATAIMAVLMLMPRAIARRANALRRRWRRKDSKRRRANISVYLANCAASLPRSAAEMTIESPTTFDSRGIGLHQPAYPTLAALMGAAQFLQMIPLLFL